MKKSTIYSRRSFIKTSAAVTAGLSMATTASAYANITGANDRLNVAVIGTNGRGNALIKSSLATDNVRLAYVCDVDKKSIEKGLKTAGSTKSKMNDAKGEQDFRKILDDPDIDAIMIAAPDHWHAPMSLMALKAGKDVYVEKPCGHNPHEGEILIKAQQKYGKIVQMGNQQRSAPTSMMAVQLIRDGAIGTPYYGKAWYANTRGSIGHGKFAPVPEGLDYDLWQGPAPHRPYQDNLIHYNWHWFKHWGTGEICNNGTHEIDICRWALGVDYPIRVASAGGRYHFKDDWEFYDSQTTSFDFEDNKSIIWEGMSCNGLLPFGRGRGAMIQGTDGTILLDRNGFIHYDLKGKVVKEEKEKAKSATTDTVGAGALDTYHMQNFAAAIRDGAAQNSHIVEGHKSVLLCHLGNIAQDLGRSLTTNPENGKIIGDDEAMGMWSREYQYGYDMSI